MLALFVAAASAQEGWDAITSEKPVPVPVPEEWSDGLTPRPTRSPAATISGVAVVGGPSFGTVQVGYGGGVGGRGATVGLSLGASTVLYPAADGTSALDFRTVSGEGWVTGQKGRTRHGVGVAWYQSVGGDSGWYLRHPAEGGRRLLLTWDAYRDRDRLDWSFGARMGGSSVFGPELVGDVAASFELAPSVALTAGIEAGFAPAGSAVFGVDLRPAEGLEITAGLGTRLPLFDSGLDYEVQPALQVKGWL